MSDKPRRREDKMFDPSFVSGLETLPSVKLREHRSKCEEYEAELSYARRLIQGKMDILGHELERRAAGGESGIEAIRKRLPVILSDGNGTGISGDTRHTKIMLPRNAEVQRREIERIASETLLAKIDDRSSEELTELVDRLSEAEVTVSDKRREAQSLIDRINSEIIRRYKDGEEDPSALLTS